MADKIEKIGENHIVVIPEKEATTTDGKSVMILDEDNIKEYGQAVIDRERKSLEGQIDYWNKVDTEKEKAKVQEEINKIELIQTEMDKPEMDK